MNNIPVVKLGIIAVSRDCFPIQLSEKRRAAIKAAYTGELYECPVTVENEKDMEKALEDVNKPFCPHTALLSLAIRSGLLRKIALSASKNSRRSMHSAYKNSF